MSWYLWGHHGYVDDSPPCRTSNTIIEVIQLPERGSMMLLKWFADNQMKIIIIDCHLLVNKNIVVIIRIEDPEIKNNEYEEITKN